MNEKTKGDKAFVVLFGLALACGAVWLGVYVNNVPFAIAMGYMAGRWLTKAAQEAS